MSDKVSSKAKKAFRNMEGDDSWASLAYLPYHFWEMRGEGCYIYDEQGKAYLDCLGSGGIFALGYRHPKVMAALQEQLECHALASRYGVVPKRYELADKLCSYFPDGCFSRVFFGNSGTESVEAAMKLARLTTGRHKMVGMRSGYHGMSQGTLSPTKLDIFQRGLGPMLEAAVSVPEGDREAVLQAIDEKTAAVILEPLPWAAGCPVYSLDYFQSIVARCHEVGALVICDEVQTGLGRTGRMFACQHFGFTPDILCIGKILSGGVYPISATLYGGRVQQAEGAEHINLSSFGGNPAACATGLAVLEVLEEENLVERSEHLGNIMLHSFEAFKKQFPELVVGHMGLGTMRSLTLSDPLLGMYCAFEMVKKGYIIGALQHRPQMLRISPPFVCQEEELLKLLAALLDCIKSFQSKGASVVSADIQSEFMFAQEKLALENDGFLCV